MKIVDKPFPDDFKQKQASIYGEVEEKMKTLLPGADMALEFETESKARQSHSSLRSIGRKLFGAKQISIVQRGNIVWAKRKESVVERVPVLPGSLLEEVEKQASVEVSPTTNDSEPKPKPKPKPKPSQDKSNTKPKPTEAPNGPRSIIPSRPLRSS
jgi:hypothetical protein